MGFVDENGDFPKSKHAFACDALATSFGSLFGLSPVTSFIESGAGVEAGSRTGLTAVFCGLLFLLSIFFAPIIASIPPWASGGALVIVGALMSRSLGDIKWHIPSHALTAFLTVVMMPLTYSIAYGLIAGIMVYSIMEGVFLLLSFVGIDKPVFAAPGEEEDVAITKKPEDDGDGDDEDVPEQAEYVEGKELADEESGDKEEVQEETEA